VETHVIRLRGGWECASVESLGTGSIPLTLPARAESLPPGRLRLTRRFNRPPRVASAPVVLRLSRSRGIHSLAFNGRPIGPTSPDRSEFDLDLGDLAQRNELAIEAEPPREDTEWGLVSLIFE
jgi:hypothetical protein